MRMTSLLVIGVAATVSLARAVDLSGDPYGLWKPLRGATYKFHSGIVADAAPPTANDRRLTFLVDGKTAKEIFDLIGPDYRNERGDEKRDRYRSKQGISCFYTAQNEKEKDGPYRFWIGLDLRTGSTVNTISC